MFRLLTTNPWPDLATLDPTERAVYEYLTHVRESGFCPFVRAIERREGYWLTVAQTAPSQIDLDETLGTVLAEFEARPRIVEEGFDPTTLIMAFGHEACLAPGFKETLTAARERWQHAYHWSGFMIAEMYPDHPDSAGEGRFSSSIPLVICDRMHPMHRRFMTTPERRAAFRHHFPEDVG